MSKDHSPHVLAFGLVLAIVGLIFAASYARADSFNERFSAVTPKSDDLSLTEQWGVKLLLIIDGKIAQSVGYSAKTFTTSDACRNAILTDKPLQVSAQAAAEEAVAKFGETAKIAIACAMRLD
jgi:hypothetical protein